MSADRRRLELELDRLITNIVDPMATHTARAAAADELRRRVRWLAGNRDAVLMPTPRPAAVDAAGAVMHTVTIGPAELAGLRHALSAIVGDSENLRRIACSSTPAHAEAALRIPTIAAADCWFDVL